MVEEQRALSRERKAWPWSRDARSEVKRWIQKMMVEGKVTRSYGGSTIFRLQGATWVRQRMKSRAKIPLCGGRKT